jgi:hypothetical protein
MFKNFRTQQAAKSFVAVGFKTMGQFSQRKYATGSNSEQEPLRYLSTRYLGTGLRKWK